MSPISSQGEDEGALARKAQQADTEALAALRDRCHPRLVKILMARGANLTEAEDILADIWSDCVPGVEGKPSLLAKFGGKFSLLSWLARVATNRWIDQRRREVKHAAGEETDPDEMPGSLVAPDDDTFSNMLRESLRSAFACCSEQALILLRLVYQHGLTQREVGRMVGWSEAKTSRTLAKAMDQIKTQTLQNLKRRDAGLELLWEDLLGLCASDNIAL